MSDITQYLKKITESYYQEIGVPMEAPLPKLEATKKLAMIISPHPDDECINGGLAVRLQQELGYKIINVPYSLGSAKERQDARYEELKKACAFLNFELSPRIKEGEEEKQITELIEDLRPDVIFTSHDQDRHPTHIRCGQLVQKILSHSSLSPTLFLHEFWHAQKEPNLLVEFDHSVVLKLMQALLFHQGEINRNPYHLRLPFWMADNTRRGSELVGGTLQTSGSMLYSSLYRAGKMEKGTLKGLEKKIISRNHSLKSLFT